MRPESFALIGQQRLLDVGIQLVQQRIELPTGPRAEFIQSGRAPLKGGADLALLPGGQAKVTRHARCGVGWRRWGARWAMPAAPWPTWSDARDQQAGAETAPEYDHDEKYEP